MIMKGSKMENVEFEITRSGLQLILKDLHRPNGLLERRAWDIPLNFNQEVDDPETPTEALEGYFQEIIDFLEQEVN
tara:strand:- start:216 stop:443 length:228 start_codon:yes stop_codon:yes gene_type:complete